MNAEDLVRVIGEPMRYKIFQHLLERKHCVRSLSRKLGISESAVSQHLKVMREAGLVYGEKYGYHTHYMPSQEAVDLLADTFGRMRQQSRRLHRQPSACQCDNKVERDSSDTP